MKVKGTGGGRGGSEVTHWDEGKGCSDGITYKKRDGMRGRDHMTYQGGEEGEGGDGGGYEIAGRGEGRRRNSMTYRAGGSGGDGGEGDREGEGGSIACCGEEGRGEVDGDYDIRYWKKGCDDDNALTRATTMGILNTEDDIEGDCHDNRDCGGEGGDSMSEPNGLGLCNVDCNKDIDFTCGIGNFSRNDGTPNGGTNVKGSDEDDEVNDNSDVNDRGDTDSKGDSNISGNICVTHSIGDDHDEGVDGQSAAVKGNGNRDGNGERACTLDSIRTVMGGDSDDGYGSYRDGNSENNSGC